MKRNAPLAFVSALVLSLAVASQACAAPSGLVSNVQGSDRTTSGSAGHTGPAFRGSSVGLGSAMTTAAGLLGSSASGAAATAVVASAVGGPVVLGSLVVAGCGLVGAGAYKLGRWLWK